MKRSGFRKHTQEEIKLKMAQKRSKMLEKVQSIKNGNKTPKNGNFKRITMSKKTITSLKKQLWKIFSKFVRERDKYRCFTCGKEATGSGMHAGHFITGATCPVTIYFDERNVHAQCYHCNINLSGNWVIYERKMIDKYGQDIVNDLKLKRTLDQGTKLYEDWYEEKINYYKERVSM